MKSIICFIAIVFLSMNVHAQGKHSIAIGADWLEYSKPHAWRHNNSLRYQQYSSFRDYLGSNSAYWISYYYRNEISLRFYFNTLQQIAYYKDFWQTPESFLFLREATFYDFTLGYNFSNLFRKKLSSKIWDKTGIWVYAGLSKLGRNSDKSYHSWSPIGGWNGEGEYHGTSLTRYSGQWKPTAQFMIKYNPVRFVFLGVGGTYHHVDKEFKPLSFNVTAGLQL